MSFSAMFLLCKFDDGHRHLLLDSMAAGVRGLISTYRISRYKIHFSVSLEKLIKMNNNADPYNYKE